ncbi:MAG: CapA family protein [Candidatus Aminicenantes bacterium]|nr:CapA family protein [Candidatus Aminicenantes bacterium]
MKQKKQFRFIIVLLGILLMATNAAPRKQNTKTDKMTLIALGDCILSHKVSSKKDPAFLKLVDIIRSSDCTWANCELPMVEIDKAYPQHREMDLPGAVPPWVADEFKWLGIDFVGFANNHTMDYGYEGLFSTIENLKRVGIGYAGAGKDLEEAARPRYIDAPGGRVGQVSCCGSFHKGTQASLPNPYVRGRPGLNHLRVEDILQVKKESFDTLKKIFDEIEQHFEPEDSQKSEHEEQKTKGKKQEHEDKKPAHENKKQTHKEKEQKTGAEKQKSADEKKKSGEKKEKPEESRFMEFKIVPGDKIADVSTLNEEDLKRITDAVKVARRNARIVIVSNHEHRGAEKQKAPAEFFKIFARACIDAGADVVFNTGPHRLWGIEIYKNKPIFYSLGNFFFQITDEFFPSEVYADYGFDPRTRDGSLLQEKIIDLYFNKDCYWQGVVPVITFEKGSEITGIELYPISLGRDLPLYEKGTPVPASKKEGKAIIEDLSKMSAPYKTAIEYRSGVGIIKLK